MNHISIACTQDVDQPLRLDRKIQFVVQQDKRARGKTEHGIAPQDSSIGSTQGIQAIREKRENLSTRGTHRHIRTCSVIASLCFAPVPQNLPIAGTQRVHSILPTHIHRRTITREGRESSRTNRAIPQHRAVPFVHSVDVPVITAHNYNIPGNYERTRELLPNALMPVDRAITRTYSIDSAIVPFGSDNNHLASRWNITNIAVMSGKKQQETGDKRGNHQDGGKGTGSTREAAGRPGRFSLQDG